MRYARSDRRPAAVAAAIAVVVALGGAGLAQGYFYSGTSGDDTVRIERSGSTVYLRGGDDRFFGAKGKREDPGQRFGGSDHVRTGPGDDRVFSYSYGDMLRGRGGADVLDGGARADGLYGGVGDDRLIGGAGVDLFKPREGRDTCVGQLEDYGFPGRCEVVRIVD